MTPIDKRVREAEERIRPYVLRTPLVRSDRLSAAAGRDVYLKLENLQVTGSFKIRGVMNRLLTLGVDERSRGLITASTGNHGLAVAHAVELLGLCATIVLPATADPAKVARLRALGVAVESRGSECAESEAWARSLAESSGRVYLPPYNDPDVVAGQGTIGPELLAELGSVDAVFASVGGGGLIAGVAGFLKKAGGGTRAVGCLPENSPVMYDSMKAGRIVESQIRPTLSDSTAGGVEPGAITFDLCRRLVDDWVLVTEGEIRRAMALIAEEHDLRIEGAAGVAVAGFLRSVGDLGPGRNAVIIICGGNIDRAAFEEAVGPRPRRGSGLDAGGGDDA
jgi:threonine dehydratase